MTVEFPRLLVLTPDGPQGLKIGVEVNSAEEEKKLGQSLAEQADKPGAKAEKIRRAISFAGLREIKP